MKKSNVLMMAILLFAVSCKSTQPVAQNQQPNGNPPSVAEIFQQLDTDKDGRLSASEVKGPLQNDFAKIDTNGDGFITKQELNKAPKPNRQSPPPNRQ